MIKKTFSESDAWLLTAIVLGKKNGSFATLQDIIGAADYLNHAIITWEELETGLERLIGAGYVIQKGERFKLTKTVNQFWISQASKKQRVMDAWAEIERFIGVSVTSPGPTPTPVKERFVPKRKYHDAVIEYTQH